MRVRQRPRLATLLGLVAALPLAVLGVGFFFHTDYDPAVLGKWSGGHFALLLAWWLVLVPVAFLLVRFAFTTSVLELPSGRTLTLRWSVKVLGLLLLGAAFVHLAEGRIQRATGRGVATPLASDVFHPYLQNVPRASRSRLGTNAWGFRGAPLTREKPEGAYRIFLLGGSTVFCAALPLEATHAERLRERLQEAAPGRRIEVQNAGAEWHSSEHSLIKLLTQVQAFHPDLIVVWHGINDLYRSFSPEAWAVGSYRDDYGHFHGAVAGLVRPADVTWRLVRMRLDRWFSDFRCDRVRVLGPTGTGVKGVTQMFFPRSREVEVRDWPSLGAFERNMTDLVQIARAKGMQVIVASQPYLYRADLEPRAREVVWFPYAHQQNGTHASIASMAEGMRRFNATSREVARAQGARFVDLEARIPKTLEYLYDDVHYTVAACDAIGEALADQVLEAGWLEDR